MTAGCRFLLDENIHLDVADGLRREGIDAVHVRDLGLLNRSDEQIMNAAISNQRIVVTGDIRDFGQMARFFIDHGIRFPGVLLVPSTLPSRNPGVLIRAIRSWVQERGDVDEIPGGVSWLSREMPHDRGDRFIREPQPAYRRALRRLEAITEKSAKVHK